LLVIGSTAAALLGYLLNCRLEKNQTTNKVKELGCFLRHQDFGLLSCNEIITETVASNVMKNRFYIYTIVILFVSCSDSNKKKTESTEKPNTELNVNEEHLDLEKDSNITLSEWVNFYENSEPDFSLNKFEFQSKNKLNVIQGNVFGNFDSNFDQIYSDFLIFREDKAKYVDFDSYGWSLNENKEILFSPDQEINLVDIKKKTVVRIAFRGPSQWTENIFWQNDSIIVLLENTYEKQPIITKIDINKMSIKTFIYSDTLNFESDYTKSRFKKLGLQYE
jgi:hypothetical protein